MADRNNRNQQAIVYLRVAHMQEDSDRALTAQREACRRIAERHGLSIVREYADLARPAKLEDQFELRNLLSTLAVRRDAAYVIVWDYTRLSRNLAVLTELIEQFQKLGTRVVTLTGVEVAERFIQTGGLADEPTQLPEQSTTAGLFPLALIKAAFHGLSTHQSLAVTALLPSGETVNGTVIGIGSRLSIQATDGELIEDIRAEWIVRCSTQVNE